jgi:hypothetical protein
LKASRGILGLFCLVATQGWASHQSRSHPVWVDGSQLAGYEVAVAYLNESSKHWPMKFDVNNYEVAFEGHYTFHFAVIKLPEEENSTSLNSRRGPTVRIKVDPKAMKVVSSVEE